MQVHLSQARDEKNLHVVYQMKMSKNLHTTKNITYYNAFNCKMYTNETKINLFV